MTVQKRTLRKKLNDLGLALVFVGAGCIWPVSSAFAADPFAANNGLYPTTAQWSRSYRISNYDYPKEAQSEWLKHAPREKLTTANAAAYVDALKAFVEPSLEAMIDSPDTWDPVATGWFSMPWTAEISGTDATSGREAILGSFSGQVIQGSSFKARAMAAAVARPLLYADLMTDMQNHTVVYYDPVAATMLRKVWADPFNPAARNTVFPEGALVVKAGAVTATPAQWPVVTDSAVWNVFRPPFSPVDDPNPPSNTPVVTPLRVLQFDVIVKDTVASPQTGWVFITWVYDRAAPGKRPWDRLVPLGAMWGNDPEYARDPKGTDPSGRLQETWINPKAPAYAIKTLGWGGRLSGPIDVSLRHGVVLTNGEILDKGVHASSCLSCHGTSQYPFVANLYPSPNKIFPQDGKTFLLYPPGSPEWAQWFANRPGNVPQSAALDANAVGLDYDMLLTFALSNFNNAAGHANLVVPRFRVH
jgi:hypothetical protein